MTDRIERSHWPISALSSIAAVFNMLIPLVLARYLPSTSLGHFRIFFFYLANLPAIALTTGLMSGLGYWAGQGERKYPAIKLSGMLVLGCASFFLVAAYVGKDLLHDMFQWEERYSLLFALSCFGAVAASFFEEAAIASGRIWTGAFFYAGFEFVRTSAILVTTLVTRDLAIVLVVHTLLISLKVLVGVVLGIRLGFIGMYWSQPLFSAVLQFAFPVSIAWLFGIFVTASDQIILSTTVSPDVFALYSIGCLSIPPLFILEQSVGRILIPQLSSAFAAKDTPRAVKLYRDAVKSLSFLLIPAVAGLVVYAHPIIILLFTEKYRSASAYLQLFAFSYLLLCFPYDAVARARGDSKWILQTFLRVSFFSLSLTALLSYLFGPIGALIALLTTSTTLRSFGVITSMRVTKSSFATLLPMTALARNSLLAILLSFGAISSRSLFDTELAWFLTTSPLFAFLYLPLSLWLENSLERFRDPHQNILIIAQNLHIGGLERMIVELAQQLHVHASHSVTVFLYEQDVGEQTVLTRSLEDSKVSLLYYRKGGGFSIKVVFQLLKVCLQRDVHIIHSHHLGGLLYASIAKVLTAGRFKIVHTQHSFLHFVLVPRYRRLERYCSLFVDRFVVVSPSLLPTYEELGISRSSITTVPNGVSFPKSPPRNLEDLQKLRASLFSEVRTPSSIPSESPPVWVLALGRVTKGKGQRDLIGLWKELPSELRNCARLLIVGPEGDAGELDHLEILADRDHTIVFCGSTGVPGEWIRASNFFVSLSHSEGMPLAALEAIGGGLDTLLSKIDGHQFLTDDATLVPLDDRATQLRWLSKGIVSAKDDLCKPSRQYQTQTQFRKVYSSKEMVVNYEKIYKSLLVSNSTG